MSYNNTNNYVKFIKGTLNAFNKLNHKDSSTLYFITNEETKELQLYLGDSLISSTSIEPEILSLHDLLDVTLSQDTLTDGSLLVFDKITSNWVNTDLNTFKTWLDIPSLDVMKGATEIADGKSGLVPTPTKDVKDNFLRGDGTWTDINPIISSKISEIINDAPAAFDTLQEIAEWILTDGESAVELVTEVGDLKKFIGEINSLEDEKTLIEIISTNADNIQSLKNRVETLEDILVDGEIDLTSYVKIVDFEATVGSLNNELIKLESLKTKNKNSLVEAINELHQQLTWGNLDLN